MRKKRKTSENLCYCGHDCARCVTYLAAQTGEEALCRRAQEFYSAEFGIELPSGAFRCGGGRTEDVFVLCRECPFRLCCREKKINACAECSDYPCAALADYRDKYVNRCNQIGENEEIQ